MTGGNFRTANIKDRIKTEYIFVQLTTDRPTRRLFVEVIRMLHE